MRPLTFTSDNRIKLLHCGEEYVPALVDAIDAAEQEIYLETYIFAVDDVVGDRIRAALIRAAERGVRVRVIVDWHGTGRAACALLKTAFEQAGAQMRVFNPWFRNGIARTHRKLSVIDRKVAFVGGMNVNDDLHDDDDPLIELPYPRWDFTSRIEGPLVAAVRLEITAQWARLGGLDLKERWQRFRSLRIKAQAPSREPAVAALVVRDNLRNRRAIMRAYLHAIGQARGCVTLANPYFAPGRRLRRALESAARRGVEVTLLLGVGQYRMQDAVAHSYYPRLLRAGVKLVEYQRTQLHAKVAMVDDRWATVGSSNCDGLSLFVNQEANIVVEDADFARSMRKYLEHGIKDGVQVQPEQFANIPWYKRLRYSAAYLLYVGILRAITLGRYA